jgi:hypothetical protein
LCFYGPVFLIAIAQRQLLDVVEVFSREIVAVHQLDDIRDRLLALHRQLLDEPVPKDG